ncbi:5156_t:CDS:2 [Cetraspora pellucida]|uniref:5156_t:CDS:1 n=1 Tax=Cetraspora pellucida TaxID=1433469 RepID=A0ACA9LRT3_9GLOM|nr:5156_t:CDS:2 [Cetraspora pellucida]
MPMIKYVYDKYDDIQKISNLSDISVRRKNTKESADQSNPKKHDDETENMKQHLLLKHEILLSDEKPYANPDEKHKLQLDKMIKKATSHCAQKQAKLKRITTEWLVIDALSFSIVYKKGYQKM